MKKIIRGAEHGIQFMTRTLFYSRIVAVASENQKLPQVVYISHVNVNKMSLTSEGDYVFCDNNSFET